MSPSELRILEAFGSHVYRECERCDLSSLEDMDAAKEAIFTDVGKFQSMALATEHYVRLLRKSAVLDAPRLAPLQTVFLKTRDRAGVYYAAIVERRQCAIDVPGLPVGDGIVEAYEALLAVLAALHNGLNALAWIIGEQIAETDNVLPGSFSSADDLFSAMGV